MPFLISQARPGWFEDKVDKVYDGVLDENGSVRTKQSIS